MTRTFIRQATQIRKSDTYSDVLAAGSTLASAAVTIEDDLNALRSQAKRALGEPNWYDDLSGRDLATLSTDLLDIETKRLLRRVQILTDITVPTGQDFKVLSVAGAESPTLVAAVALTQSGAVVAQSTLSGAGFQAHELIEIAGQNAVSPKNLVVVRDALTGQKIQSSGRDVFGLLQYEATGADGAAFDDTAARVKISFVRMNAALDDLEPVPVADIEDKQVNYVYSARFLFDDIPEDAYIPAESAFIDQSASVDVTRQNAYDNQGSAPVELTSDADLDLGAGLAWALRDALDADLFRVTEGSAGGTSEVLLGADVDVFNVDAVLNDFASGISARTAGTRPIDVGVNDGVIETTAGDMELRAAGELLLDDANQTGSTWAQTAGIRLSDTTGEWDAFEVAYGEVSLLSALVTAKNTSSRAPKVYTLIVTPALANTDVTVGVDMSTGTFLTDYDVFLNGSLMQGGADASSDNDYYPGTDLSLGQIRFEFVLTPGDIIAVIKYGM